jgi:hypothetical protein
MTTFDKREEAFEKQFAHDEELKFKAEAKRNRQLGLWAAEKQGITGEAAVIYARDAVAATFAEGGDNAVMVRLARDLSTKGIKEAEISSHMSELMTQAIAQVKAGV